MQTQIPEVEEATIFELNKNIAEKKNKISRLIETLNRGRCINSKTNDLINLAWVEGTLKAILALNKQEKGIGEISLKRFKRKSINGTREHITVKIKYTVDEFNNHDENDLISRTTHLQKISDEFVPEINWDEMRDA